MKRAIVCVGLQKCDQDSVTDALQHFDASIDVRCGVATRARYVSASVGGMVEHIEQIFPAALVPLAAIAVKAAVAGAAAEAGRRAVADSGRASVGRNVDATYEDHDAVSLSVGQLIEHQTR